jgi:hypothetical protein
MKEAVTMRALVIFESAFGNTQRVAQAIADGLSAHMLVDITEVGVAPDDLGHQLDLLVVGGPTQGFSMSRPGTRESAAKQASRGRVSGTGLREWLARGQGVNPCAAAAFDTRFKKPRWLTGSAARAAEKRLREIGYRIAAPAESFFVAGTTGPLVDGELDRARRWGNRLGSTVTTSTPRV